MLGEAAVGSKLGCRHASCSTVVKLKVHQSMSGVPFGLMAGLLFKFFSRMAMAKCTAESPTTFLVEVAFQMIIEL